MKRVIITIFSMALCILASAQISQLSDAGKRHWNKAQMYIKNGSTVFDAQQAIKELETLIQTNKYPEAYLELGKLYGKFNTTDKLRKSEEYFRLYSQCPGAKNIDNEKDELAVKRELRYNAFRQALIGKWRHEKDINAVDDNGNSKVIGGCMFDIEIYMDNEMNLKAKVVSHAKSNEFSILFWQEVDVVYDPDADAVRIHYSFMMHDDEEGWWDLTNLSWKSQFKK